MTEDAALYLADTPNIVPTPACCLSCGNRLGKWFGQTFVMHHRGRVVRVEGCVQVVCEDCGSQVRLTAPGEGDQVA